MEQTASNAAILAREADAQMGLDSDSSKVSSTDSLEVAVAAGHVLPCCMDCAWCPAGCACQYKAPSSIKQLL
jgi:hypothetical protein